MLSKDVPVEYSQRDRDALAGALRELGNDCHCILEIGVARTTGTHTSTSTLITLKPRDCTYLGVDEADRSFLVDLAQHNHTICCNSYQGERVRATLRALGHDQVDLLHIDGYHSICMALSDWHEYAQLLRAGGVAVLHDTSVHPGPACLYDAIDETLFDKQKLFEDLPDDWGLAICRRR
jgi:hypothetical protein